MNPRMTKEIRTVLPAFGLMLAAAVVPLLLVRREPETWMIPLFALGCVFMGALAFGAEFQQGTIDLLLVQPLRRSFIWREKMIVLGMGLAVGTAALSAVLLLFRSKVFADDHSAWLGLAFIPLSAFCATPLLTLLSRSSLVGVLASFLVPIVILSLNSVGPSKSPRHEEIRAAVLLLAYCGVSYWLGRRRFEKLQAVDEFSLPFTREMGVPAGVEAVLLRPFRAVSTGISGRFGALLKKELRLQLISFVAAGLFFAAIAIESVVLALRYRSGKEDLWAWGLFSVTFFGFIAILPAMVGAMSVAEEKTWGVADWQLTLPPSIRQQWTVKMLVTLSTSLLLGFLLPWGLMWALIQLGSLLGREGFVHGAVDLPPIELFVWLFLGQLLLTSLAIYASSLAGSTARSILLAFGMLVAAGVLIKLGYGMATQFREVGERLVHTVVGGRITTTQGVVGVLSAEMVLLIAFVQQFAYVCYRDRRPTRRQILFQALALGSSVVLLTVVFLMAT